LEMKNISKSFSGVTVLDNVDFNLQAGEVHVLLGENGAGKSTLIKILSGAYQKSQGEVFIEGKKVVINNPNDAFGYGVGVIYQEFNLNPHMSIYENIFLGKEYTTRFGLIDRRRSIDEAETICSRVGLTATMTTLIKDLSIAQKQMVEIAKAIVMNVKILVLDEPTATLTENEINKLFEIIRELKTNHVGVIYISHRMKELKEIGDRCTVLRDGCLVKTVNLKEASDKDLIRMMVGRNVDFEKRQFLGNDNEVVLEVNGLSYKNLLRNISFKLHKGTILGIAGLVGSGRTEIAKCIMGEICKNEGKILIKGTERKIACPTDAIKYKIVYLSEDRKSEGLILKHDVKCNVSLAGLDKLKLWGLLSKRKEKACIQELINKFKIKTRNQDTLVRDLSGGNQQKVVIAKWIFCGADIYIIDEPTRGIDVGARQEVYSIMEELLKSGVSIIMISSDLVEVLKMSDEILVMCKGEVAAILDNHQIIQQEEILKYAVGGNVCVRQ